jgi:uncharacterized protein involved in exopolysaccharide biosynthesis
MTTTSSSGSWDPSVLRDLGAIVRRRWRLVLFVFLGTVVGAYVALQFTTEQYQAEAQLLVKLGRENAEVPLTVEKGGVYSTGVLKEEINSYVKLLESRSLLEATVDTVGVEPFLFRPVPPPGFFARAKFYVKQTVRWARRLGQGLLIALDLKKDLSERDQAIELLSRSLTVDRERDSNVIRVTLRLPSATLARDTVSSLLELYLRRHVQVRQDPGVRALFDGEVEEARQRLQELQKEIGQIRDEWGLRSVAEQRTQLLERLTALHRGLDDQSRQLESLSAERGVLEGQLQRLPRTSKSSEVLEPSVGAGAIRQRLADLRLKRVDAANRYADEFPLVKSYDEEIATLEGLLTRQEATQPGAVTYQPDPLATEFEREAERIKVKQGGLASSIRVDQRHAAAVEATLRKLDQGESKVRTLELERRVLEEKFVASAGRSLAARTGEELDQHRVANVAVLSPPTAPAEPVSPRKVLLMILAAIAGLSLGLGAALLAENTSEVVHDARDLGAADGWPLLGAVRVP